MKRAIFALCAMLTLAMAHAGEPFRTLERDGARSLVDAQAHAAPTIIALWSTECPHCKRNLELFTRMAKQHARLRLITVAVEPLSPDLAKPLERLRVPGARYAYGQEAPEALAHALDAKWRGELPRALFFDGRGNKTAISGVVDAKQARDALGL
jgi:thiol-disulfide isomerase/thioredoxin